MAPDSLKRKQNAKQIFDDELGDDFLSSWKPTKSMAALNFEEDEPAPNDCKTSFSLGKMDTNFDFDFDGGLNALSKFNVDMSDLDLPSSHDKTVRTKDGSQDKQRGESKFSFQFNGFDEFDLDDTLKTNKESETPVFSKQGKRDVSPPSTANKYRKKGLLDSFSDDASESTSAVQAGTSINKENHTNWKEELAACQETPPGGRAFSDDENSMHEFCSPLQDKQEQAPRKSENCMTQKRKDYAKKTGYALDNEVKKVAPPTLAHMNMSEECDDTIKTEVEKSSEPDIESRERFSNGMKVKVLSSENEIQELPAEKDSLRVLDIKEEQATRLDLDDVPQANENLILGIVEEESKHEDIEQQKILMHDVDTSQVAELDCIGNVNASFSPKHLNETHTIHPELSPQASLGRSAKRKFSEEQTSSDSPLPKQSSSKKQVVDSISTKTEERQASDSATSQRKDSATSQRKCEGMTMTSPQRNHCDTALLGQSTSKPVPGRLIHGVTLLNRIKKPSVIQAPRCAFSSSTNLPKQTSVDSPNATSICRSLLRTPGKHPKFQGQTPSVEVKPPATSLPNVETTCSPNVGTVKKPTILGSLRSPSFSSPPLQKRTLLQLNATNSTTFQGKNKPVAEKQLEGPMPRKTSSVAVLSKSKATGASREAGEKAFKFDVEPSSKGNVTHPSTHSSAGLEKLESVEARHEKLPTRDFETPDTETVDDQMLENSKNVSGDEMVPAKGEEHPWAVCIQNDDGLSDKSEYYGNRMDQLLKELRDKYEEAMDLRVRAIVINNTFLMLNNPVDDEKIRKIARYVRERLRPDTGSPVLMQSS